MKLTLLSIATAITAFAGIANAGTLAAQSLKCKGVASLDAYKDNRTGQPAYFVTITTLEGSSCRKFQIPLENQIVSKKQVNAKDSTASGEYPVQQGRTQVQITNLGNQLVVIVDNEPVILNNPNAITPTDEIARKRLAVEQQRAADAKAVRDAGNAVAATEIGVAVGGAAVEAVGSLER